MQGSGGPLAMVSTCAEECVAAGHSEFEQCPSPGVRLEPVTSPKSGATVPLEWTVRVGEALVKLSASVSISLGAVSVSSSVVDARTPEGGSIFDLSVQTSQAFKATPIDFAITPPPAGLKTPPITTPALEEKGAVSPNSSSSCSFHLTQKTPNSVLAQDAKSAPRNKFFGLLNRWITPHAEETSPLGEGDSGDAHTQDPHSNAACTTEPVPILVNDARSLSDDRSDNQGGSNAEPRTQSYVDESASYQTPHTHRHESSDETQRDETYKERGGDETYTETPPDETCKERQCDNIDQSPKDFAFFSNGDAIDNQTPSPTHEKRQRDMMQERAVQTHTSMTTHETPNEEIEQDFTKRQRVEATSETRPETANETRSETTSEARMETASETRVETSCQARVEAASQAPPDTTREARLETADETRVETANETKSETASETRLETATETRLHSGSDARLETAREAGLETVCEARLETASVTTPETTSEARMETASETKLETACEARVKAACETPAETTREARLEMADETRVETADETRLETAKETTPETADETRLGTSSEARLQTAKETKAGAGSEARVEAGSEARVEAGSEARVETASEIAARLIDEMLMTLDSEMAAGEKNGETAAVAMNTKGDLELKSCTSIDSGLMITEPSKDVRIRVLHNRDNDLYVYDPTSPSPTQTLSSIHPFSDESELKTETGLRIIQEPQAHQRETATIQTPVLQTSQAETTVVQTSLVETAAQTAAVVQASSVQTAPNVHKSRGEGDRRKSSSAVVYSASEVAAMVRKALKDSRELDWWSPRADQRHVVNVLTVQARRDGYAPYIEHPEHYPPVKVSVAAVSLVAAWRTGAKMAVLAMEGGVWRVCRTFAVSLNSSKRAAVDTIEERAMIIALYEESWWMRANVKRKVGGGSRVLLFNQERSGHVWPLLSRDATDWSGITTGNLDVVVDWMNETGDYVPVARCETSLVWPELADHFEDYEDAS